MDMATTLRSMPASLVSEPLSTLTSVPTATPGGCNPLIAPDLGEVAAASVPYCQFSWRDPIPDLQDCCADDVPVHTWDNCTQFCKTGLTVARWQSCIEEKLNLDHEDMTTVEYQYRCQADAPEDASSSSTGGSDTTNPEITQITGIRTPTSQAGSTTTSGGSEATQSGTQDDEGTAARIMSSLSGIAPGWITTMLAFVFGLAL